MRMRIDVATNAEDPEAELTSSTLQVSVTGEMAIHGHHAVDLTMLRPTMGMAASYAASADRWHTR